MINAKEARERADAMVKARRQEYEAKIAEAWKRWEPDVESAIDKAVSDGKYTVEVRNFGYGDNETEVILEDMITRHINSGGYRTRLNYAGHNTYRLIISWKE